jgi:glutamyl-Q tRNA(Asp) synthetase
MKSVKTRFAPSPTGHLHLGHLYAAQVAHDLARKLGGQYLLRFEDIDETRTRDEYYQSILDDLAFFNLQHDAPPMKQTQSDRVEAYANALNKLDHLGVTYPCFCSRKDIEREISSITSAPHGTIPSDQHYPGTCKKLTSKEIKMLLDNGKIPSIRIDIQKAKLLTRDLSFTDLIHGEIKVIHDILGDTVLARRDIGTSYHIASVVDDAFQEITHVTRGDDLLESTHLHRILQRLLNLPEPTYHHHPLILDDQKERLAKRSNSISVKELREQGLSLDSLNAMIQKQLKNSSLSSFFPL